MRIKILVSLLIIFVFIFFIQSCSKGCNDEKDDIIKKMGQPDDIDSYSSSSYTETTYWYWSAGIAYTFKEGEGIADCEVSTYTFSPIPSDSSESEKMHIKQNKKIEQKIITFPDSIIR